MNTERARKLGIIPQTKLKKGIQETIEWYKNFRNIELNRYNAFTDKIYK